MDKQLHLGQIHLALVQQIAALRQLTGGFAAGDACEEELPVERVDGDVRIALNGCFADSGDVILERFEGFLQQAIEFHAVEGVEGGGA